MKTVKISVMVGKTESRSGRCSPFGYRRVYLWTVLLIFLTVGMSCEPGFYKQDADREVYEIIDSKWQERFGSRSNYIINDLEEEPAAAEESG